MGAFQQVCSFSVEHEFFADRQCKQLSFVPTEASLVFLRRTGLMLRPTRSGAALFCDVDRLPQLHAHVHDAGGALALLFKVYSADPHFARYTLPAVGPDKILFFDTQAAHSVEGGRLLLHANPCAEPEDCRRLLDSGVDQLLDARTPNKPAMLVQLVLDTTRDGLCQRWRTPQLRDFVLRFKAGQTRWKYLLFGELSQRDIAISDGKQTVFHQLGSVELPGRQVAKMFLSDAEIPMRETPDQRFQLKENGGLGEKVLIKRMPTACVGRVFRELVGEQEVLVSEIYINQ